MVAETSGIKTASVVFYSLPLAPLWVLAVVVMCISAAMLKQLSQHILVATSPLPLPEIFAGASTPSPTLCCRPKLASHFSQLPTPTLWSGLKFVSSLWVEEVVFCSFLCILPFESPLLHATLRFHSSPLVPPVREFPSIWKTFPPSWLLPFLGAQVPVLKTSFSFFFNY